MKHLKQFLYSILFVLLTAILLFALANLLRDKETTLAAMYSEPSHTLDVAIVGSSHVNNGYIPNILWEANGLSACNVFSWSQPMWTAYHYIKETLKTQSPKVIVLDMYGMMYGHSYIQPAEIDKTNYANSFNISIGLNYLQLIKTAENVGIELRPYENFLNFPRYHTRWKTLNTKMFTYSPYRDKDFLKGYGLTFYSDDTLKNPNIVTEVEYIPYEFSVEYLEKIVQLCKQKEINLIFTMVPYVYNQREAELCNWIDLYAREHDIPFINYNDAKQAQRIGFDFSADMSDMAHLNYAGAVKITEDISEILKPYSNAEKDKHRNARVLSEDYEKYYRVIHANDIMTENELNRYLTLALEDINYSLFVINSGSELDDEFFDILANHKFTLPPDKQAFTLMLDANATNLPNENTIARPLFQSMGTVEFRHTKEDAEIYLNGQEVISQDGQLKMVLYDEILQRPLETVVWNGSSLQHKEFTSDIINLFKK